MKYLTIAFSCFIVLLIIVANFKLYNPFLPFVKAVPYGLGDQLGHFVLMGFLAFLVNMTMKAKTVKVGSFNLLLGSLIVAVFVTLEEGSQYFLSTRTCDWFDLMADYLGILLFGRLAWYICQRKLAV